MSGQIILDGKPLSKNQRKKLRRQKFLEQKQQQKPQQKPKLTKAERRALQVGVLHINIKL